MRAAGLKVGQLSLSSRMVTSRSAVPLSSPMSSASSSSSRMGGEKASRSMTTPDLTVTTPGTQHHQPGRCKGKVVQWGDRARANQKGIEKDRHMVQGREKGSRESTADFLLQRLGSLCLRQSPSCQSPGTVPCLGTLCKSQVLSEMIDPGWGIDLLY